MVLNGIQLLLNYDIVPPSDARNILRVLVIQANSGKPENQLKLLQIVLQLANFLAKDSSQYLTEAAVCSLVTLSFQLCDIRNNVSVQSTAFATARQIISLVLGGVCELSDRHDTAGSSSSGDFASASLTISAQMIVKDVALFIKGSPGEWCKGSYSRYLFRLSVLI